MNDATGRMQFGFKAGTGTIDAIFALRTFMFSVTRILKVPGFAMFIDLRKAFPSLSRPMTIETFRKIRVPWKLTRAIASLMSGTSQRLRINGMLTRPFVVTSGTPEGSINSPEMFAIVYKELLEALDIHELPADPSLIDPHKVYYVIFADDLSFLSLDLQMRKQKAEEFKERCVIFDMAMNPAKSKWMAFLPEGEPESTPPLSQWKLVVDGTEIENVDEFLYLGYKLNCRLNDEAHVKMINERYIKAAKATGKLMRDLRCFNLISLKRFFVSMVFSQLYGLVFVDARKVEYEKGVGAFLKASLGLPASFPHVVAVALLNAKHVRLFRMEQCLKLLLKWEICPRSPAFDALVIDRAVLFPAKVGFNALLGDELVDLGLSKTLDYRTHYQFVLKAQAERVAQEHRVELMATEGRAFWTEIGLEGHLSEGLVQVMTNLSCEEARIVVLLLGDMLCWSCLKCPTRVCPSCKGKFTTSHFFSCPRFFSHDEGWRILMSLCATESWEDVLDFIFHVLVKWVSETHFFRPDFRLTVVSYSNICTDAYRAAFRWNV